MEAKRQRETALAIVAALLAVAAYAAYSTWSTGARPSTAAAGTSNEEGRASRRAGRATPVAQAEAPQVHLDALGENRPKPDGAGRDLFRFKEKPPPPPPPPPRPIVGPQLPAPPPPPPPVPPITLKFIGVLDTPPPGKRVAVLSDGRGAPVYGHEGDTVLGQYRIVRIGAESIEMMYLDGRGRQTIRLSGS
jgi:hypothetical protein